MERKERFWNGIWSKDLLRTSALGPGSSGRHMPPLLIKISFPLNLFLPSCPSVPPDLKICIYSTAFIEQLLCVLCQALERLRRQKDTVPAFMEMASVLSMGYLRAFALTCPLAWTSPSKHLLSKAFCDHLSKVAALPLHVSYPTFLHSTCHHLASHIYLLICELVAFLLNKSSWGQEFVSVLCTNVPSSV